MCDKVPEHLEHNLVNGAAESERHVALEALQCDLVWPIWQSTRRMLTGVPMQLMTEQRWTASQSRCTSPSGQPAHDLTLHLVVVCTVTATCWEWYAAANAPLILIWESQVVLCLGGAAVKMTKACSASRTQFCDST